MHDKCCKSAAIKQADMCQWCHSIPRPQKLIMKQTIETVQMIIYVAESDIKRIWQNNVPSFGTDQLLNLPQKSKSID